MSYGTIIVMRVSRVFFANSRVLIGCLMTNLHISVIKFALFPILVPRALYLRRTRRKRESAQELDEVAAAEAGTRASEGGGEREMTGSRGVDRLPEQRVPNALTQPPVDTAIQNGRSDIEVDGREDHSAQAVQRESLSSVNRLITASDVLNSALVDHSAFHNVSFTTNNWARHWLISTHRLVGNTSVAIDDSSCISRPGQVGKGVSPPWWLDGDLNFASTRHSDYVADIFVHIPGH